MAERTATPPAYQYTDGSARVDDLEQRAPSDIYEFLRGPRDWNGTMERHECETQRSRLGEFKSVPARDSHVGSRCMMSVIRMAEDDFMYEYFREPSVSEDTDTPAYDNLLRDFMQEDDIEYLKRRLRNHRRLPRANRPPVLVVVGTGIKADASHIVTRHCKLPGDVLTYPNTPWKALVKNRDACSTLPWTVACANTTSDLPIYNPWMRCPPGMPPRRPEADARRVYSASGTRLPSTFDCAKNQMLRCIQKVVAEEDPRVRAIICLPQLGTASTELRDLVGRLGPGYIEVKYVGSMKKLLISRMRWVLVWSRLYRDAVERSVRPGGSAYKLTTVAIPERVTSIGENGRLKAGGELPRRLAGRLVPDGAEAASVGSLATAFGLLRKPRRACR
ncbi:hypothetical protein AB1Y20_008560 [Prymnesium parvum]|uniref:Uncharacterized protein n=1 Tax=Prymnesium parvum TaxID=97485 RepID=A0AB34IQV0_PRYPA